MTGLLDFLPFVAATFAIPQFLPQIAKLRETDDTTGVSWPWAALTSVNNAAWLTYFTLAHYWTALVPSISATTLAGVLATMLTLRVEVRPRSAVAVASWTTLLVAAFAFAGRAGLGTLLTGAFILQVAPSIWTAYRAQRPTGVSRGTWTLILGELSCWLTFGVHRSDPRLVVLGCSGVAAALLMLARIERSTAVPVRALVGVERLRGGGEEVAMRVRSAHEVQVAGVGRVGRGADCGHAGVRDRGRRQPPV
jgi:uncharacterized protein with PQ loop repeat